MRGRSALLACSTVVALAVTAGTPAWASANQLCPIRHWGEFTGGRVNDMRLSPTPVPQPGSSPVVQVASSNSTEYALLADGTLWAWGLGSQGQLGDGTFKNSLSTPVRVRFPGNVSIASIPVNSMPFDTGLAVDTTGRVWGWGRDGGGDLCLGNERARDLPAKLPLSHVTALAGAANHAVYDADGVLYSCGTNSAGVLGAGAGAPGDARRPVRVKKLPGRKVTALVSSFENAGALLSNGEYFDWGRNTAGQLGDGGTRNSPVPVRANVPSYSAITQVAQGGSLTDNGQTLVMLADGALYGWGSNGFHQLDPSGPGAQLTPRQLYAPAGVTYAALASGGSTSYALSTSRAVYAWGQNDAGQVGDGTTTEARTPVWVASSASLISATAKNVVVGCALGAAG
jgi:alpha-tubulin suppressor-like RCC1 family protein